jgi:hypothetical protein
MSLKPLEVKTVNIATKAVTSEKIADNAIETRHIKEGTVTPDKLTITPVVRPLTPALDTSEIKDAAITSAKIAPNAITTDHIAANSVATDDIKDGAITKEKIRDGAITKEKMADGIIGTAEIIDGSITAAKLATNSVTQSKIAANSVGASEIIAGAVGASELANNAVTTDKILDASITQAKLAPGVGGGSQIVFLPTRVQMTSLIVMGNQDWIPTAPNPSIPAEAVALILQVELVQQSIAPPPQGWLNCRFRRDATQQECFAMGVEARNVGQIYGGQAIVPITAGSFQYAFTDTYGNVSITFNPYVIGYVI